MTGSKPVALPLGDGPINFSLHPPYHREDYSGLPALTPSGPMIKKQSLLKIVPYDFFELRMTGSKPVALPLGDGPITLLILLCYHDTNAKQCNYSFSSLSTARSLACSGD